MQLIEGKIAFAYKPKKKKCNHISYHAVPAVKAQADWQVGLIYIFISYGSLTYDLCLNTP